MKKSKKVNLGMVLGIGILFIMVIGVTYAAFKYTSNGTKENSITTSTISFKYNETSSGVTITNAMPIPDSEGKKQINDTEQKYFDFDVTSTIGKDTEIQYYVYAVDITGDIENKLDPKYVKVYLTDQSSLENAYKGYDGSEVPVYSELDNVSAQDKDGEPVEGKLLYQNKFIESGEHKYRLRLWLSDEYEGEGIAKTFKIRVDVNTDAVVTPNDNEKPTCEIVNASPKKASRDEDITMTIKCSDNNGEVTSNMTSENVHVKVNDEEVEPTKKDLTEGIATAAITGANGVQHTLTLNGFNKEGQVSIKIDKGVITDKKGNTNDEINIDTGVSISKRITVTLKNGGGITSFGDKDKLTCDLKDSETCNVTLPNIVVAPGYTGSFWSEQETAHSGIQPTQIEVSSDKTYYAIGEKEVTTTFTKGEGVKDIGKENDTCKYYGKETSCKVELPTITEKEGYDEGYFTTGEDELQPESQVDVSDNIEYTAKAKDVESPVCKQVNVTPQGEVEPEGTVTIEVECTDNSGTLATDLKDSNITVTTNAQADSATKSVDSGTTITNGKKYTINLTNFSGTGTLAVTISANSIKDASNNGNIAVPITTGITIKELGLTASEFIEENTSSTDTYVSGNADSHKMYKFNHSSTDLLEATTSYRYIGTDPYNYVTFNNEKAGWRIIGIIEDKNSSGKIEKRFKLIKNESIGNDYYIWNSSDGGSLRNELLKSVIIDKDKLENMSWYTSKFMIDCMDSTTDIYNNERKTGSLFKYYDNVGVVYMSDYGFTVSKGIDSCYDYFGLCYIESNPPSKSWLLPTKFESNYFNSSDNIEFQLKIDGRTSLMAFETVRDVNEFSNSCLNAGQSLSTELLGENAFITRPVVYLKANVKIKSGSGKKNDPYVFL